MPRDPKRIDRICDKLVKAWGLTTDIRLGQFLILLTGCKTESEVWVMEDDVLEYELDAYILTGIFKHRANRG